ncbi:Phospholipase DDHD1 [Schistosoma japonicum]|nr:Phospholipase DDHD1 [Schistosoma japonicum]
MFDSVCPNSKCDEYSFANYCYLHKNHDFELKVGQVRWFYRDANNKRWLPFNGYDSINLESNYRIHLVCKNECLPNSATPTLYNSEKVCAAHKVSVRGGLYEADLDKRCCVPTYWPADKKRPTRILRGTWFREGHNGTLEPFDNELMAERLEAEYVTWYLKRTHDIMNTDKSSYSCSSLFTKIDITPTFHSSDSSFVLQNTIQAAESIIESSQPTHFDNKDLTNGTESHPNDFTDCHVDWYGEDEFYLYYESTSLYIRQKLGMQKVGIRLFRGFSEEAQKEDKIPDITHLCFVIHGIGQKMGINLILNNCNELRDTCDKIKTRYFSHLDKENKRVEFLPVEWRTVLQLDGDTVESITPVHLRGFRTVLNSSAMDIMYYTSPLYRAEIISSLKSELNRLYDMFRRLNPDFESHGGKVSIIAHSLGCVLVYDLITGWNYPSDNDPLTQILLNKSTGQNILLTSASKLSDNKDKALSNDKLDVTYPERSDVKLLSNGYLEQIARVSFRLETAKTLVNNLEQELNSLLLTREKHTSYISEKSNITNNLDQQVFNSSRCSPNSSLFQQNPLLFANNLENLFCLGSPLGVYLVLRGIRPGPFQTQDPILPRKVCRRIFNIYHPADPVAYRLEPLILKYYSTIQPSIIHRVDAVSKPCYDSLPLLEYSGKEFKYKRPQDCVSRFFGLFSRATSGNQVTEGLGLTLCENECDHNFDDTTCSMESFSSFYDSSCKSEQKTVSSISSSIHFSENDLCYEPLQLERRLDFELQASRYENMYFSLLTSHTNYWTNADLCMFIMTYLFQLESGSKD